MPSTARGEAQPITVRLTLPTRVRRLAAITVGVVLLPALLTACGLIGGGGEDNAPVVIPSEAADETASEGDQTSPGDASPSSSAAAAPAPTNSTVTRTGIVVQRETRTRTATKTLPKVTVTLTKTPAPITLTETRTETRTEVRTETVFVTRPVIGPAPGGAGAAVP